MLTRGSMDLMKPGMKWLRTHTLLQTAITLIYCKLAICLIKNRSSANVFKERVCAAPLH